MDILKALEKELGIKGWQVEATVKLIDEGNTIPFIARYRKEMTGSLSDEVLRDFNDRLVYMRNLEAKKEQVIASIDEQGKLTDALKTSILSAKTLVEVDDLYRPYRPKRRTRATIAKEKGLEPLATLIWMQNLTEPLDLVAAKYINEEKEVKTAEDAIHGAKDILAEMISDEADYRKEIRRRTFTKGKLIVKAKDAAVESVYEMYYDYDEEIKKIAPHRILAINRGEKEKILVVKIEAPTDDISRYLRSRTVREENPYTTGVLEEVIEDSYKRLIGPAIEREIRNDLTENAEEGAIKVFGTNLVQLLMQPPIMGKVVLALDPAFRTGCKIAVIDGTGKVLDTTVIYPTPPVSKVAEAKAKLKALIETYKVDIIAIGNGTASRESELFVVDMLKEMNQTIHYIIVNEAGASVYSASKLGTEEFPTFDVALRSAVSIGRRLQDPLAELVKIDPKSIGVGQYQHDMNQKRLGETLSGVVEDCVNKVGVDLNTASPSLLQYISGINKTIAKNIVNHRETEGKFANRKQLLKVAKLGPKAYEQCAGFLRIINGDNPLDNTGVHPESYKASMRLMEELGYDVTDIKDNSVKGMKSKIQSVEAMAENLGVGVPTLEDIMKELEKPGRDPREEMPKPILRTDVLEMEDLQEGMILKGTVRNVIDFGAFVDIGVHQDGLVHISQMADKYIKHPLEVVAVGDIVDVKVINIDVKKKRIGLSMKA
ncbi:RNA-binding transcriptional accessory protein [Vallitalea pronyensis]|uniref:RNA-binding transcriptional accessory protein n=1 Tax=Vallitalea pronyensis TaxID=1348613 RepID=A0A8J8SIW2_9FIRM|nr:Tex family protein [Vallitalea pronyensis]QUI24928.1 RNA-binding transcriptional accessory protein [Vallitalea pronyensis]